MVVVDALLARHFDKMIDDGRDKTTLHLVTHFGRSLRQNNAKFQIRCHEQDCCRSR